MISISTAIKRSVIGVIDLLFPLICIGCGQEGSILCDRCVEKMLWRDRLRCDLCGKIIYSRRLCAKCRRATGMYDFVSIGPMEGLLRDSVHNLKYENLKSLAPVLGQIITAQIISRNLPKGLIVPMPLHYTRMRWRGYNQSCLLVKSVSQCLGWTILDNLVRIKKTHQQMKLRREARVKNVEGAFLSKYDLSKCDMPIYLVDDVATTGATMGEAVKILKKAGVRKIVGVAIAVER